MSITAVGNGHLDLAAADLLTQVSEGDTRLMALSAVPGHDSAS